MLRTDAYTRWNETERLPLTDWLPSSQSTPYFIRIDRHSLWWNKPGTILDSSSHKRLEGGALSGVRDCVYVCIEGGVSDLRMWACLGLGTTCVESQGGALSLGPPRCLLIASLPPCGTDHSSLGVTLTWPPAQYRQHPAWPFPLSCMSHLCVWWRQLLHQQLQRRLGAVANHDLIYTIFTITALKNALRIFRNTYVYPNSCF